MRDVVLKGKPPSETNEVVVFLAKDLPAQTDVLSI
jgi:hypothetical protein